MIVSKIWEPLFWIMKDYIESFLSYLLFSLDGASQAFLKMVYCVYDIIWNRFLSTFKSF